MIVHTYVFDPIPRLLAAADGFAAADNVEPPDNTVHKPLPVTGTFAPSVYVFAQTV